MDTTDPRVRAVLAIVRQVLNARTDWVLVGEGLAREIEARVSAAPESGGSP